MEVLRGPLNDCARERKIPTWKETHTKQSQTKRKRVRPCTNRHCAQEFVPQCWVRGPGPGPKRPSETQGTCMNACRGWNVPHLFTSRWRTWVPQRSALVLTSFLSRVLSKSLTSNPVPKKEKLPFRGTFSLHTQYTSASPSHNHSLNRTAPQLPFRTAPTPTAASVSRSASTAPRAR